jgi:malate permease and related proteins
VDRIGPVFDQALWPIAVIVAAGWLWRRTRPGGVDGPAARRVINTLVMYVFYPALAFFTVARAELNAELVWAPLLTVFAILLGAGLAALAFSRRTWFPDLTGPQFGALVIACALANIVSLGIPVLQAVFGPGGERYAIYADILGIAPLFWTLGFYLAARYGTVSVGMRLPEAARVLARLPPIWAFAAGAGVNAAGLVPPGWLMKASGMLGYATMPCMLLTVGMSLAPEHLARHWRALGMVTVIKMVLVPLAVYAVGAALLGAGELTRAVTLVMGMPTMMASMVLAERFGLDVELLASMLVGTTVLYFAVLPVALVLLAP